MSLLRSSKSPDKTADIGLHSIDYAIMPFMGTLQQPTNYQTNIIRAAYEFNIPIRFVDIWPNSIGQISSIISISNTQSNVNYKFSFNYLTGNIYYLHITGVIVETLKVAEDGNSLIVRLFESFGGKTKACIQFGFNISRIFHANSLETKLSEIFIDHNNVATIDFSAFQICTLLIEI